LSEEEQAAIADLNLITLKPVLYVANVAEAELGEETPLLRKVRRVAQEKGGEVVVICGELEAQISQLPESERGEFLKDMGLEEPGLDVLVRAAYKLLDLETFFTAGRRKRARGRSIADRRRTAVRARSTAISSAAHPRRRSRLPTTSRQRRAGRHAAGRDAVKEGTKFRTETSFCFEFNM
jgi:ribosome-binding ATPase YchF (GTP1/OBG family)